MEALVIKAVTADDSLPGRTAVMLYKTRGCSCLGKVLVHR
jgi:hypothetical protein